MTDWKACLENPRGRFTLEWFREHVATKELLKSGPFFGNVLDVGCGIGGRTYIVAEAYPAAIVYGIDISLAGIEHARQHFNRDNTLYRVDDATRIHFDDNEFDFVFTLGVIEHIQDTTRFLGEIKRVMKPDGQLFIGVTENNYHSDSEHVHTYTLESILPLLDVFHIDVGYVKDHIIFLQARRELKLNLGCGGVYLPGYVNIDKVSWGPRGADLIADVLDLNMYGDGEVDHIHTYGLLEHIPPWSTSQALGEWLRVLRPGGTIHIEVPNLHAIFRGWLVTGGLGEQNAINLIYGGNKSEDKVYQDQHHLTGFTLTRLARMMSQAGFESIRRVESERTQWALAVEARR